MTVEMLETLQAGVRVTTNKGAILTVTSNTIHQHADVHGRDRATGCFYHSVTLASVDGKSFTLRTREMSNAGVHSVNAQAAHIAGQMEVA